LFKNMTMEAKATAEFWFLLIIDLTISLFAVITTFTINREYYTMLRYPAARVQAALRLPGGFTELRRLSTSVAAWTGNVQILPYIREDFYEAYANLKLYIYLVGLSVNSDPHLAATDAFEMLKKLTRFQVLVDYYAYEIAAPTFVAAMANDSATVLSFGPAGYPVHTELTKIYTALINEAQKSIYRISYDMNMTVMNMMFIMALLVLVSIVVGRRIKKSKVLIVYQNELQKNHIMQLTESQEQIRMLAHDFKQKVDTLRTLNDMGKSNELTAFLSEISQNSPISDMLDTGNVMMDAVLSSKETEALRNQINFTLKMDIPHGIPDISIDICTLLGNALDNAIEGCARAPIDNRFINIEIRATKTQFLCLVINTLDKKPIREGCFLKSSKTGAGNHGIGLKSMKQTCDALGGDFCFEYTETHFKLQIYLPVKSA